MTASASQESLCNRALMAIGSQSQISGPTQPSVQANACNVLYVPTFQQLGRAAYWNCLRQQVTLSLLAAAGGTPENPQGTTLPLPPTPWLYMYQLPSNCLMARYILMTLPITGTNNISPAYMSAPTCIPGQGQIPFHVAYSTDSSGNPLQVILTNQTQAQLVYTVNQTNPQIWDSEFEQAFVASLAAFLVPALSLNMPLMNMQIKLAEQMIMNARVRDANEGSNSQDRIPDWMIARNTGNGYNNLGSGNGLWNSGCYGAYSDMGWGG